MVHLGKGSLQFESFVSGRMTKFDWLESSKLGAIQPSYAHFSRSYVFLCIGEIKAYLCEVSALRGTAGLLAVIKLFSV